MGVRDSRRRRRKQQFMSSLVQGCKKCNPGTHLRLSRALYSAVSLSLELLNVCLVSQLMLVHMDECCDNFCVVLDFFFFFCWCLYYCNLLCNLLGVCCFLCVCASHSSMNLWEKISQNMIYVHVLYMFKHFIGEDKKLKSYNVYGLTGCKLLLPAVNCLSRLDRWAICPHRRERRQLVPVMIVKCW